MAGTHVSIWIISISRRKERRTGTTDLKENELISSRWSIAGQEWESLLSNCHLISGKDIKKSAGG